MTGVTDDAMVVEQETGTKILLVEGSYQNIKITTPEDLADCRGSLEILNEFLKKIKNLVSSVFENDLK